MHRSMLICAMSLVVCVCTSRGAEPAATTKHFNVDFRALVSRADLDYDKPATRSEEGQPIGNGRMGSLVWTTPSALHFQINRVDVFGQDSYTTSFPSRTAITRAAAATSM